MEVLFERVAGLDVHRDTVMACVRRPSPKGRGRVSESRQFATFAKDLRALRDWLVAEGVTDVAMEATGVYWKPVFSVLEASCSTIVVNAAHMRNVPGRKTDMADAAWIAQLLEHGLLSASFIPPLDIRQLRNLTRYKRTLIQERTRVIQRLEKTLQDAGVKLTTVTSTVLTMTGRAIIEALITGENDPAVLAGLAKGRLRPKIPALTDALESGFDDHHRAIANRALIHVDFLDRMIVATGAEISTRLDAHRWAIELLCTIPGVGPKVAEVMVAEIGTDMSTFPSAAHLASWAGMCPGNRESAGKRGPGSIRPGSPWLRQVLVEASWAAARDRTSYLGIRHARIRARRGAQRATIATGHAILVAAWHILSTRTAFMELGVDYYQARYSPEAQTRRLVKQLEALGHHVTIDTAA